MLNAIKDDKLGALNCILLYKPVIISPILPAEKIRQWLGAPDSSRNQNEARDKRQVNTCAWFFEEERFRVWKENPGFLWVKGKRKFFHSLVLNWHVQHLQRDAVKAFFGESPLSEISNTSRVKICRLSSWIVDQLPEATESVGIGYFFFDGRDSQKELQLHNKLIRSLISQLSDTRHGGMTENLADLYKRCGEVQQPSDEQLENVLCDILGKFSQTYIMIDALDECTEREKTLNWVKKLISDPNWKVSNLHIVVTSRPERNIDDIFAVLDPHSIDVGEANVKDIVEYLKLRMTLKFMKYDENIRAKIMTELERHAEGSYVNLVLVSVQCWLILFMRFRWVVLQLSELEKCSSRYEIDKQLAELPKGLDEIYNRILKNVDEKHRADTRMFLQWLAFCDWPMEIEELAETITADFSDEHPIFNQDKRYTDPHDVLERCSGLVSESEGKYN